MILLPKYQDREIIIPSSAGYGIKGEFRLVLMDCMGKVIRDTGWFPNLITQRGLINVSNSNWNSYTHIGSSSAAPSYYDTTLTSHLAYSNTIQSQVDAVAGAPNYEVSTTLARRFAAGVGTGTIREMGINNSSSNTAMCIRSLVSPAITKLADQVLDVYHKFSIYRRLTDQTGTVSIGAGSYSYTLRGLNIDESFTKYALSPFVPNPSPNYSGVSNGGLVALTAQPAPSVVQSAGITTGSKGEGYTNFAVNFGLNEGNISGGFNLLFVYDQFNFTGGVQVYLSPKVPKTASDVMTINMQMTWAAR